MNNLSVSFIGGRGFSSSYGGVENAIRHFSLELSKHGVTVYVYGIENERPKIENNFIVPVTTAKFLPSSQLFNVLFALIHVLLKSKTKNVILFASGPCAFTFLFRIFGLNVITSLRAIDSNRGKWNWVQRGILRFGEFSAWRFSNSFTVNSLEMYDFFKNKREDLLYVPNGASNSAESFFDRAAVKEVVGERDYLFFSARLDPVKRLDVLIKAFAGIKNKKVKLIVAGGNSKSEKYTKQIKSLATQDVIFLGHIDNNLVQSFMRYSKIFILPSLLEGMSNSLLSAMAMGKPCITSDARCNTDVLPFEECHFKLDDVDSLKDKIDYFLENPKFTNELARKIREYALSNYCWSKSSEVFLSKLK